MSPSTPVADARITQVREWIARADREGLVRDDLQLHLSHRDLSILKRSPSVATEEISFADGVMRFLGVAVSNTAATESRLGRRPAPGEADSETAVLPAVLPAEPAKPAKPAKKRARSTRAPATA
ncbi:MAG: hypothetical protein ABW063_11070 [Caulobacter sp.]